MSIVSKKVAGIPVWVLALVLILVVVYLRKK